MLHAFLPHKFIDHTHATAVLSLADQPDAAERIADLYGPRIGIVPYIMPGFLLAKKAAEVFEADPAVEGLVLLKHGVFSFGDTAREAYERMIAIVSLAEERLARGRKSVFAAATLPPLAGAALPRSRRSCAAPAPCPIRARPGLCKRFVLDFRGGPAVLDFVDGAELSRYGLAGVATPDHTIRTKNYPLIVPPPEAGRLDDFAAAARAAVERFVADYHAYFARHNARQAATKRELDPMPRVILVPGLGLFGLGRSAKDAAVAADLAESLGRDRDRRRGGRPIRVDQRSRDVRHRILVAGTGKARPARSRSRSPARSRWSPAAPARSARRPRARCAAPAPRSCCSIAPAPTSRRAAKKLGGFGVAADVTDAAAVRARLRPGRRAFRRGRYRRLERRRRLAGPDRRGRRHRSCATASS